MGEETSEVLDNRWEPEVLHGGRIGVEILKRDEILQRSAWSLGIDVYNYILGDYDRLDRRNGTGKGIRADTNGDGDIEKGPMDMQIIVPASREKIQGIVKRKGSDHRDDIEARMLSKRERKDARDPEVQLVQEVAEHAQAREGTENKLQEDHRRVRRGRRRKCILAVWRTRQDVFYMMSLLNRGGAEL